MPTEYVDREEVETPTTLPYTAAGCLIGIAGSFFLWALIIISLATILQVWK